MQIVKRNLLETITFHFHLFIICMNWSFVVVWFPALSHRMRTFTSLLLLKSQTYLYLRRQLWPLELSVLCPCDWVIRQHSAGRLCQMQHAPCLFISQFTSQESQRKGTERGEKLSDGVATKSYYTQKVILVYLSSLLSLLVQAYRNRPIWFFFFFQTQWASTRPTLLCSALLASVQHYSRESICLHLFLQIASCRGLPKGHCVPPPPLHWYPWPVLAPPCTSAEGHEWRWLQGLVPLSMHYHYLMKLANLKVPCSFYNHKQNRLDVYANGNLMRNTIRFEYCCIR